MGIEMKGDVTGNLVEGSPDPDPYSLVILTDHIWGVVDIHPDTDYPDVRNFSIIQSNKGSALLIPRERDLLRLYIQLSHADLINPENGRVDKSLTSPQKIIDMAQEILKPYYIESTGDVEWWTVYASKWSLVTSSTQEVENRCVDYCSRPAGRGKVLCRP